MNWKEQLAKQLPLLGHRNWILIVDKAYPMHSAPGMVTINTKEKPMDVLSYVLESIKQERHTTPIIYVDKELDRMNDTFSPGVEHFQEELHEMIHQYPVKHILHEEVFDRLNQASKLFDILVLKTDHLIPYTSIFMELDCGYWSQEKEELLREMVSL